MFSELPDLVLDTDVLRKEMWLDFQTLQNLQCASEENCLAEDADGFFRYLNRLPIASQLPTLINNISKGAKLLFVKGRDVVPSALNVNHNISFGLAGLVKKKNKTSATAARFAPSAQSRGLLLRMKSVRAGFH